jgi:glucans biosynthesis protein
VRLIEIPSPDERHDNIVAFWTPEAPVTGQQEVRFSYSLLWSLGPPLDAGLARTVATLVGGTKDENIRRFVLDFDRPTGPEAPQGDVEVNAQVEALNGKLGPVTTVVNPMVEGWRVMFTVEPSGSGPVELRCLLLAAGRPISETWLYRQDSS